LIRFVQAVQLKARKHVFGPREAIQKFRHALGYNISTTFRPNLDARRDSASSWSICFAFASS